MKFPDAFFTLFLQKYKNGIYLCNILNLLNYSYKHNFGNNKREIGGNMKFMIISGGHIDDAFALEWLQKNKYDCMIAADSGMNFLHRNHIVPDVIAGDFDSVSSESLAQNPERPFVAILGGAKVADKLNVIDNLLTKVDTLIIGGGMAYTFNAAKGYTVGKSLLDETKIDYCREMMAKAEELGVKLLLPVDNAVADNFPNPIDAPIEVEYVDSDQIPADKEGMDIGPKTAALYADAVISAKTVVWNGPMGVFENPTLAKGTIAVAQALADSSAITIVGGGDSAAACEQLGYASKITHISTGGGASLEFLEGKDLPGISCLLDK